MVFEVVFFFLAGAIIFAGGHYFIYFSLIKFFNIANLSVRYNLLIILAVLSLSFFVASILARFKENIITRALYFLSGVWLGLALNLVLASLAIWAIYGLILSSGLHWSIKSIAAGIFLVAIFFSIYGVKQASQVQIKNFTVQIKNLPSFWQNKKIVQISDLHLGHIHKKNFLEKIVEKTNDANPDLIAITGDLFDGMDGDLAPAIKPLNYLKASQGVFFVTGNHENYLGIEKTFSLLKKTKVTVLNDDAINIKGLQIVGLGCPAFDEKQDLNSLIASLDGYQAGLPTILLTHIPDKVSQTKKMGVNLQLSGHTHKGQLFPLGFLAKIAYGRYYYGLHQEGYFNIYTNSGLGTWGPPMRTSGSPEIVVIKLVKS